MEEKFFSSMRLEEGPGHDRVGFWQGGAKTGELVLTLGTGRDLMEMMKFMTDKQYIRTED